MGAFSGSFLRAAQFAGDLLRNSVCERYCGLDYGRVLAINDLQKDRFGTATSAGFAALWKELAGESSERRWSVARNGAVFEQEQILTTHNLASLWKGLELGTILEPQLLELANQCFAWVCQRQRIVIRFWQAKLQALKKSAYAWRQMVFFVSGWYCSRV